MTAWIALYRSHGAARSISSDSWSGQLRKRLIALSNAGFCDPTVQGRFTYKQTGGALEWSIRSNSGSAPVALRQIPDLESAELSLMALEGGSRRNHLHMFTIMVEGKRLDGSAFALAVHLPDDRETEQNPSGDRQGLGACGHAALHCHVGPTLDTPPKVRVPLPALGPVEAFDWVISQIVPTASFEPAPWASVLGAMKKASA